MNGGFEEDRYLEWPGYAGANGGIRGWEWTNNVGINPVWVDAENNGRARHAFTDNGTIPEGRQAALIQNVGRLYQRVDGFEAGKRYRVRYRENARHNHTPDRLPTLRVTLGDEIVVSEHPVSPVEDFDARSLPYHVVESADFVPPADGAYELAFETTTDNAVTVLIDNVEIVEAGEVEPVILEHLVAVRGVCAWPVLVGLEDGAIAAFLHNVASHTQLPGDVDCYVSRDGGMSWRFAATAAPRTLADSNRVHICAGLDADGDLVLLSTGWHRPAEGEHSLLEALVCRSADAGRTWEVSEGFPSGPDGEVLVPFGRVARAADGSLRATAYRDACFMVRSDDEGATWTRPVKIDDGINEGAILHLGGGRWLAAIRSAGPEVLRSYRSDDDGATWTRGADVSEQGQIPGDLIRLQDGRILLVYGDRRQDHFGVEGRISADEGQSWSTPFRLVNLPGPTDCGYPSSVQRADGTIVTAYYAGKSDLINEYHMGVVIWRAP